MHLIWWYIVDQQFLPQMILWEQNNSISTIIKLTTIGVLSGTRTFELVNVDWKFPYHIVHLNRQIGALIIPARTYHRSISGEDGSIVINQAIRDDEFDP